ncbi:type II toxin-antitoxin system VapC family toxin [Patescibacteria group bacterium]|nr:type II toxin-antitoxin system VapC family toxin [Patescibacteria group bacterium]
MAGNIKKVVVDASVILARLLPDEKRVIKIERLYEDFLKKEVDFVAPNLLSYEVANALRSAVRQKRITENLAEEMLSLFLVLPIEFEEVNYAQVLSLALKRDLSVYDASYLWLAKKKKIGVVSLDKRLERVF